MILFRADSSSEIGSGHIMRSLTLANRFKKLNPDIDIHFVCKQLNGHLGSDILRNQFSVHWLDHDLNVQSDAEKTLKIVSELNIKLIIVDHYQLNATWEQFFFPKYKVLIIDDLANRNHTSHFLIDNNFTLNIHKYKNLINSECITFIGTQFSFLRSEFINLKAAMPAQILEPKNVLVFFGGTDPTGETFKFVQQNLNANSGFQFHILFTDANPDKDRLLSLKSIKNFNFYCSPPSVAQLISQCQLYIGSGGTITWERLYLGVTGLVISVAPNQTQIAKDLDSTGVHIYYGEKENIDYASASLELKNLANNPNRLQQMRTQGLHLVQEISDEVLVAILGMPIK
ncbi:MAG: UDP-2,4-diacetamido-2,4,6-trideoxy-beta-L-altropyranose hydrolase [Pseudobdellovibrionaceae bacterium]